MTQAAWSFESYPRAESGDASLVAPGGLFAGRFRVDGRLGEGGMGVVLRAHDVVLDRPVALKLLRAAVGERTLERFRREAELTARLGGAEVVRIHGCGVTDDARPYLVLECVEGARTLDAFLGDGSAFGLDALEVVARTVGRAHRAGVVHRDLKPGNVLVDAEGRVRVADFGTAWAADLDRLTRTGELVGTPRYLAPEALRGSSWTVDPTVDVWALGAMLYEHLCGRPPFAADTWLTLLEEVERARPPRPSSLRPVPAALEGLCLRALARDPAARPPDGFAFAEALAAARREAGRNGAGRRAALAFASASFALALALLGGSMLWRVRGRSPLPSAATGPSPPTSAGSRGSLDVPRTGASTSFRPRGPLGAQLVALVEEARRPEPYRAELSAAFEALAGEAGASAALRRAARRARAEYLLRRGRWPLAVEAARPLAAEEARAALVLALAAYHLRDDGGPLREARARCRRWKNEGGRSADALACAAWQDLFDERTRAARAHAREALELDPDHLYALAAQAVAFGRAGALDEARAALARFEALAPAHATRLVLAAILAVQQGGVEDALGLAREARRLAGPRPPWPLQRYVVRCLARLHRSDEVQAVAEAALREEPDSFGWRLVHALGLLDLGVARWRGLRALRTLRDEAPERFVAEIKALYEDPRYPARLLAQLAASAPEEIEGGILFERALEHYRAGDYARCNELLRRADALGFAEATFILGENTSFGRGVPRDDERAARLYRRAAQGGSPGAMFSLGVCLERGKGLPADRAEAVRWYRKAAERGYLKAMTNLANALRAGRGGPPDVAEAEHWLRRAKDLGDELAAFNLGKLLAETGRYAEARECWTPLLQSKETNVRRRARKALALLQRQQPLR